MDSTCVASLCTTPVNQLCQQTEPDMSSGLMRSSSEGKVGGGRVIIVDSMSCRQLYLRSYKFSREEDYKDINSVSRQRTKKYLNKAKIILIHGGSRSPPMEDWINRRSSGVGPRKMLAIKRKAEGLSFASFVNTFDRLLACTVRVGVV